MSGIMLPITYAVMSVAFGIVGLKTRKTMPIFTSGWLGALAIVQFARLT